VSDLCLIMYKSAELTLLTSLPLLSEQLTHVSLVLIWMVQPFKGCVRILAVTSTPFPSLLIVTLTLLRSVELLVWRSSEVKGFVSIYAMVPVVVLRLVWTESCFIPEYIKDKRINGFEIAFKLLLECFPFYQLKVVNHLEEV
jgi:hypothetical protein